MFEADDTPESLALRPIGFIRNAGELKFETRHQATEAEAGTTYLELLPKMNFEQALQDLRGFSHIWLVWWFHRNRSWRPQVLPPRGPAQRRGVFATRSPHRPNPLGMSVVELREVKGLRLRLGATDLVEGTPVFDIKPYIARYDSFPEATQGWLDEADAWAAKEPEYRVELSSLASEQAAWLRADCKIDFLPRVLELLERDPGLHSGRRVRRRGERQREMGCGAWRAVFEVQGFVVRIVALEAGYPRRLLNDASIPGIPDRAEQLAFLQRWPDQPDRSR